MLPLDVVGEILSWVGDANDLRRWKCVSQQFSSRVRVHPWLLPPCARCGSYRYRVGPRKMCFVSNCMSADVVHPVAEYKTNTGRPLCSFACLMAQAFSSQ